MGIFNLGVMIGVVIGFLFSLAIGFVLKEIKNN